jgi:hypothetical protein
MGSGRKRKICGREEKEKEKNRLRMNGKLEERLEGHGL